MIHTTFVNSSGNEDAPPLDGVSEQRAMNESLVANQDCERIFKLQFDNTTVIDLKTLGNFSMQNGIDTGDGDFKECQKFNWDKKNAIPRFETIATEVRLRGYLARTKCFSWIEIKISFKTL